jgi:hypothetical protein
VNGYCFRQHAKPPFHPLDPLSKDHQKNGTKVPEDAQKIKKKYDSPSWQNSRPSEQVKRNYQQSFGLLKSGMILLQYHLSVTPALRFSLFSLLFSSRT